MLINVSSWPQPHLLSINEQKSALSRRQLFLTCAQSMSNTCNKLYVIAILDFSLPPSLPFSSLPFPLLPSSSSSYSEVPSCKIDCSDTPCSSHAFNFLLLNELSRIYWSLLFRINALFKLPFFSSPTFHLFLLIHFLRSAEKNLSDCAYRRLNQRSSGVRSKKRSE